jgi:hypothetical protein
MPIGHIALIGFVAKVNGALALLTWPFALYEVFAKNPGIPELKDKLHLRKDQLLGEVALDLAATLRPYWPKTMSRIIVEPAYEVDQSPSLSDDAINEMKACLESRGTALHKAITLTHISKRLLRLDRLCYWLIFATAVESLGGLIVWFFDGAMTDRLAMALLGFPILTAVFALMSAGIRQNLIHSAHKMIVVMED